VGGVSGSDALMRARLVGSAVGSARRRDYCLLSKIRLSESESHGSPPLGACGLMGVRGRCVLALLLAGALGRGSGAEEALAALPAWHPRLQHTAQRCGAAAGRRKPVC